MTVGHVYNTKKGFFVVVNKQGTIEKLPKIKWHARLYLEIMQGFGKVMPLVKLRKYCDKWKKKWN
jgi:hypothetical protein